MPGFPRSIANQVRFHSFCRLCRASVHLPYPPFGFRLAAVRSCVVSLCRLRHNQPRAASRSFADLGAHPAVRAARRLEGFVKRLQTNAANHPCAVCIDCKQKRKLEAVAWNTEDAEGVSAARGAIRRLRARFFARRCSSHRSYI